MPVRIERSKIDLAGEISRYRKGAAERGHGAVATFTGVVRGSGKGGERIRHMVLEHYPRMTERQMRKIADEAAMRWEVGEPLAIHRVGQLQAGEEIVLVAVSSPHRQAAFEACQFIVDYLKTRAPFWKKEVTDGGERWVEQRASDEAALGRWGQPEPSSGH